MVLNTTFYTTTASLFCVSFQQSLIFTPKTMLSSTLSTPTSFLFPQKIFTSGCTQCGILGTELSPLIICPGCSMTSHCSERCRKEDVRHGPKFCIMRPHLELGRVYPFMAWAAELTRLHHLTPAVHPALWHEIIDVPDLEIIRHSTCATSGTPTCVIHYGRPLNDVPPLPLWNLPYDPADLQDQDIRGHSWATSGIPTYVIRKLRNRRPSNDVPPLPGPHQDPNCQGRPRKRPESPHYPSPLLDWFPTCPDLTQRAYLFRRISRDGYLLPLVMGMGIAVLLELFSLTKEAPIPPCLHFLGKPIYDFGICRGKVRVDPHRVVSYIKEGSNEPPKQLQNPTEHFWLYFITEGEEDRLYLDVGLFVYGYRYHVINAEQYLPPRDHKEACRILQFLLGVPSSSVDFLDPYAPAHFSDKRLRDEMRRQDFQLHDVTQRFSILRDEELIDALKSGARRTRTSLIGRYPWRFEEGAVDVLYKYMKKVDLDSKTLGNTNMEMVFLMDTIYNGTRILQNMFDDEKWKSLPDPWIENCKWELGLNPRGQDP